MYNVAIIGAGQIVETVHLPQYLKRDDVRIVALVDKNIERADEVAKRWGIKHVYSSQEEVYSNHPIDITSVCTPNRFHYENVMTALKNNSHVLCEKPPAMTAEQALKMHELSVKEEKVLFYDLQNRYRNENIALLKKREELGVIQKIEAFALRRSGVPGWGHFIDKKIQGGGPLIDYGIHALDLALSYIDDLEIDHVYAYSLEGIGTQRSEGFFGTWDPEKYTVEDSLFGIVRFKNGQIVELKTSFLYHMKKDRTLNLKLYGTQAGANLFPLEMYTDSKGDLLLKAYQVDENDPHEALFKDFFDQIESPRIEHNVSYRAYILQKIIEMMYISAEKGIVVYEDYRT